jgi:hypothetical protein
MRTLTLLLLFALAPMFAHAQSLTVNCTPSFTNSDGTPIPTGTPMTFNLYKPGQATPLAAGYTSCSFKRTNLTPGATYAHYVTEVVGDKESDPSETITTQLAPADPVCAGAPPNETRSQACPAPTTGTFEQSHGWTSVAAPACWSADAWSPAAPPAGVCVTPPAALVTAGTYSYCATGTASAPTMTAIGYAAAGLSCGPATRQVGDCKVLPDHEGPGRHRGLVFR